MDIIALGMFLDVLENAYDKVLIRLKIVRAGNDRDGISVDSCWFPSSDKKLAKALRFFKRIRDDIDRHGGIPAAHLRRPYFTNGSHIWNDAHQEDAVMISIKSVLMGYGLDSSYSLVPDGPIPPPSPQFLALVAEAEPLIAQVEKEAAEAQAHGKAVQRQAAVAASALVMPHGPSPDSLQQVRSWSLAEIAAKDNPDRLQQARDARDQAFFQNLSSAYSIAGFTAYFWQQPLDEVVRLLRRRCDLALEARRVGWQPHIWYVNDDLHIAVAIAHRLLADFIAQQNHQDWDGGRVRRVDWLSARLRIVCDLWRGDERQVAFLLEEQRRQVFVDQREPELEPDLPLMRNWYHLQKALVDRNGEVFNRLLAERMTLRAASFTAGGTQAPIALVDVHALALCRLAQARGLAPRCEHVYLPLAVLKIGQFPVNIL